MTREINATTGDAAIGHRQHAAPPAPPKATEPATDSVLWLRRGAKRLEARISTSTTAPSRR
jgi:hypothetical protein